MEKTKYELKAEVQMSYALSKTLQAETQMMPMGGATIPMYAVYGRDMEDKRIWCATFVDRDEAACWVMSSKTFGRPVVGAVIAEQKPEGAANDATVAEDAAGSSAGGDPASSLN